MKYGTLALLLTMSLYAVTAYAEGSTPYLRAGAGYGTNYGAGFGFNNELVLCRHSSVQLGVGYLDHISWGTNVALTGYPLGNDNPLLSPRVSVLYGRVNKVNIIEGILGNRYEAANGFALGVGGQFPLFSINRVVGNVDVYYSNPKLPDGFITKDSARFTLSAGIAYQFGNLGK